MLSDLIMVTALMAVLLVGAVGILHNYLLRVAFDEEQEKIKKFCFPAIKVKCVHCEKLRQ